MVEWPTLDFGSGHDLGILGWGPTWGSALSEESASGFSLPLPLLVCILYLLAHSLSPSQMNK